MNAIKSGVAMAATAAALFSTGLLATATSVQAADEMSVKCAGTNSCKGTSECATASSGCKGQNGCKGQGWVSAKSAKACTDAGGKVLPK